MLHKSKGKYRWSHKATYSVDWSLSVVILAYLEKLYETIKDRETVGIPHHYFKKQAEIQGVSEDDWYSDEVDLDAAHQLRLNDLEELIYVFNNKNEPRIEDYDFKIDMKFGETDEKGCAACEFEVTGEEERNRYRKDSSEWHDRKQKGQELFGQIFNTLDW